MSVLESTVDAKEALVKVELASDWSVTTTIDGWVIAALACVVVAYLFYRWKKSHISVSDFELDSAEFGIGSGKLTFKPNRTDRQIAYAIWVELSTRKIGLEIDYENDVISEVYDSWYTFFGITRELIKEVPADKLQHKSTRAIVKLSVQILNSGVRPHLTRWQARFRKWYDNQLSVNDEDPQSIQNTYQQYDELKADLEAVNRNLIAYRKSMYLLSTGRSEESLDN
jgi:hypothetical protein